MWREHGWVDRDIHEQRQAQWRAEAAAASTPAPAETWTSPNGTTWIRGHGGTETWVDHDGTSWVPAVISECGSSSAWGHGGTTWVRVA